MANAIWSASACLTRGSFAPWPMSSGAFRARVVGARSHQSPPCNRSRDRGAREDGEGRAGWWGFDLDGVNVEQRRDRVVERGVAIDVADLAKQVVAHRAPVGGNRVEERLDVRRTDDVDAARVQIGREREAREARVPAVAAAVDADLFLVGDARVDRPAHRVGQVVLHRADAPLAVALVQELLAEARARAIVDL